MGDEARAAVALRWMIRATTGQNSPEDGDSLRNINTSVLPNGAGCYVIENSSVYRFRRDIAAVASGEDILAPIAGGGFWFRVSADNILGQAGAFVHLSAATSFVTAGDTNWKLPVASNFTLAAGVSGTQWTLGTLGQLTYAGLGGTFLVTGGWRMQNAADVTDNLYQIGISLNNDLNGTAEPNNAGIMSQHVATSDLFSQTTTRVVVMSTGDILQPRARCITQSGISDLSLLGFSLAVAPMPSV